MRWCERRRLCRGHRLTVECHANPHAKALVRAGPGRPRAQKSRSIHDRRNGCVRAALSGMSWNHFGSAA
jgi:hypothetical protein